MSTGQVGVRYLKRKPTISNMLSVTMLSSYMYCKRKLYLNRVLGIYEPPKEAMIRGTIRHEVYDLINKNEETIVKSIKTKTEIKEKYKNNYLKFLRTAILNNKEGLKQFNLKPEEVFIQTSTLILSEADNRSTDIINFIEKHNIFGEELWEKLTPKIQSELKITSEKLGLKGIIDQIELHEGNMIPIELKTGKAPREGVWPGHKVQIAAYMLLLEDFYNKEIKEGFITYLDIKEKRRIAMNAFLREEIIDLIKSVNNLLNSKEIPAICESQNKCNICGIKEDCFNEKKLNMLK